MDEDLVDHLNKCRFCLDKIKSTRLAVRITEGIENSYSSLTNSKLKTSRNYSSVICKTCLKQLDSSVGFQQKIMSNQDRLQKFEFDDTVSVKEELVEPEDLKTVEIKTECFELELPPVVQSWQEPLPIGDTEPNLEVDDGEVLQETQASPQSDEDFNDESHIDDTSESSDYGLVEEQVEEPEKTAPAAPKVAETSQTRICPYCAEEFSKGGIKLHIEQHENKINNTPIQCKFCDFQSFSRYCFNVHCKKIHPEKLKKRAPKTKFHKEGVSERERREIIYNTVMENPTWTKYQTARHLKCSVKTIRTVVKTFEKRQSFDRAKGSGRKIKTQLTEQEKIIAASVFKDPQMSSRKRAKLLGVSDFVIRRYLKKMNIKIEIDTSTQIYQCQQCPLKYSHNTTLTAHIKLKHGTPE